MLARRQAIALQFLVATRRKFDRGLPDLISLGVLVHGQPIESANDQQRGKDLRQSY